MFQLRIAYPRTHRCPRCGHVFPGQHWVHLGDFWDQMRQVEYSRDRDAAGDLLNRMLEAPWHSLSNRDSIEFFNELLRLEELCPGLLRSESSAVLARIRSDFRSCHRQDQISKAVIVDMLAAALTSEDLLALARDQRQDLDTREAAVRQLWESPAIDDWVAVNEVRSYLRELLQRAGTGGDPASAFMIGMAYRLSHFGGITEGDRALIEDVYHFHRPVEPIDKWLRDSVTLGGIARAPRERGKRLPG